MKKILVSFLLISLLASCNSDKEREKLKIENDNLKKEIQRKEVDYRNNLNRQNPNYPSPNDFGNNQNKMSLSEKIEWQKDCIRGLNTTSLASKWDYLRKSDYCDCMISKLEKYGYSKYDIIDDEVALALSKQCVIPSY